MGIPDSVSCRVLRSPRSVVATAASYRGARAGLSGRRGGARLGVARQAVVGQRLPDGGVGRVGMPRRSDPRVAVEGAEAHALDLGVVAAAAPQGRPADGAEALESAVR